MRVFGAIAAAGLLAACVSTPAPIVYGPDPGVKGVYTQPTEEVLQSDMPPQGPFQPNQYLRLCYAGGVSNAPLTDGAGWVTNFNPVIVANGVVMAAVPVNDACLSSGMGPREGRMHEGIDLSSSPPSIVYAAAPALVIEAREAAGYGQQVLLDHGGGVFTRYAHLEYIEPSVAPGTLIGFGQPIGKMGQTGNARAIHLHFEILTGNYDNPRASKGLVPQNPFNYPAYIRPGS